MSRKTRVSQPMNNVTSDISRVRRRGAVLAKLFGAVFSLTCALANSDAIDDLQPGEWYEVPNSRLQAVFPTPTPPGITGPRSVMDAWSGGAYDTGRDRLIVWGGGHCDYAGNEIYAFDIAQMSWSRITEPSTQVVEGVSHYPDGLPSSRHTYDSLTYVQETGEFVSVAAAGYFCTTNGNYENATDIYNFALGRWERGANFPNIGNSTGSVVAYDPVTGHIWAHGTYGGRLAEYDPQADTWTAHGSGIYLEIDGKGAVDSVRHNLVIVGGWGGTNKIQVWDLDNPGADPYTPSTSGDRALESEQAIGLEYDPVSDKFVGWNGGNDVYTLDPETWEWRRHSPASSNSVQAPSENPTGTYGRFRYIPSKNAFIVVSRTNENVFFYKLSAGGGQAPSDPTPSIQLDANPTSVSSGDFVSLLWSTADATDCTATGGWSGNKAVSSSGEEFNETVGPITADTTFGLNCQGPGGDASESVQVTLVAAAPVPTVNISASSSNVDSGDSVDISWTSSDADSCQASGGWNGSRGTSGTENSGALSQNTTYTLDCTGSGGTSTSSVTVQVSAAAPAPTVNLSVSASSIASGDSATLTWNSSDASSCVASGGWMGQKSTSGSQSTGGLTQTTSFTIECSGAGGNASDSVSVTVTGGGSGGGSDPNPTLEFTASELQVEEGEAVTLRWSSDDTEMCEASGDWSGRKATDGSETVRPASETNSYTQTCRADGQTVSRTIVVRVVQAEPAPSNPSQDGNSSSGANPAAAAPSDGGGGATGLGFLGLLSSVLWLRRVRLAQRRRLLSD